METNKNNLRKRNNVKKKDVLKNDTNLSGNTVNKSGINWKYDENTSKIIENHQKSIGQKIFYKSLKRIGYISIAFIFLYFYNKWRNDSMLTLASSKDEIINLPLHEQVPCFANDYLQDRINFPHCVPKKCGRLIIDNLVTESEVNILLNLAKKGIDLGMSNGSASILDLHSGALTYGQQFVNVYSLLKQKNIANLFTEEDFTIYKNVKNRIHKLICDHFKIRETDLYLTHPTFFSKLTSKEAKTVHDEYWHVHIDKHTYKSFHYTSLLYLNTYYKHFSGGRFVFVDSTNKTIEPRAGRVSIFTSASENPHFVEKVEKGVRYAITISFTCDPNLSIKDPFKKK